MSSFIARIKFLVISTVAFGLTSCEPETQNPTTSPPQIVAPPVARESVAPRRTKLAGQIIHVALDGSENLAVWQDTLDFALKHDVKFTFFVVGTHLIRDDLATRYDPPRRRPGRSDVGFGGTTDEVAQRLNMLRRAFREGHEIAGHANGHWDGSTFTYAEWISEFQQFETFLTNAYQINGIEDTNPAEWRRLVDSVIGFRAPLLAHNDAMYQALADMDYKYDTSQVLKLTATPDYQQNGVVIYPLHSLSTGRGRTITMDYNFYVLDEGQKEGGGANMLAAYQNHLRIARDLGDAPIQIGHHFARWNGGQYWWALKEFIRTNCNQPDIHCITFADRYRLETR